MGSGGAWGTARLSCQRYVQCTGTGNVQFTGTGTVQYTGSGTGTGTSFYVLILLTLLVLSPRMVLSPTGVTVLHYMCAIALPNPNTMPVIRARMLCLARLCYMLIWPTRDAVLGKTVG